MRVNDLSRFNIPFAEGFSTTQWKNLTVYPFEKWAGFYKIQMCFGTLNNTSGFALARFASFKLLLFTNIAEANLLMLTSVLCTVIF